MNEPSAARQSGEHSFGLAFREQKIAVTEKSDEQSSIPETIDDEPNEGERKTLRRVGDELPASVWLIALVTLFERSTFYGVQGLFQNYAMNPKDGSDGEPGLGLGPAGATGINTFFKFWSFVTPVFGAIVADQFLGRYNTILLFGVIYTIGLIILTVTSLPVTMYHGSTGLVGFCAAIILIGIGAGAIKANITALIAEQFTRRKLAVITKKSGERVILDPAVTIQRIYMIYYASINIGGLCLMATPYMEKFIGFWSAYLLGLSTLVGAIVVIVLGRKKCITRPPTGQIITKAFKVIWMMIKERNLDAARQSYQLQHFGSQQGVEWDDQFVEELKRTLVACKVFALYPIYWLCYGQFSANFITQAAQMNGHGIPNDFIQNFNPIAIIVTVPILDRLVYPQLQKYKIEFLPINRITLGFWIISLSMMYAAIVQHLIYSSPPCYSQPGCLVDSKGQKISNNIHIAIQTPAYILIGLSEIFAGVTGLEYAYTKAPPSMKSFVQSIFLLTSAFGAALGEAFVPLVRNPDILWLFAGLSVASFMAGCVFWMLFHKYNGIEEEMNAL